MKKIESLTFLRFIAALIVVIYHFGQKTGMASYGKPIITDGPQMVSLFFVLSGFVMMVAHYNKNNETSRDYYVTRIARIVPVYMLALALSVYFFYGTGKNNSTALLLSLTFLQSWIPPYPLSLNVPGWTLSVEAFLYLTFPFILFMIKKNNISWKVLAISAFLFYFLTQIALSALLVIELHNGASPTLHDLIYYCPFSHYCSFLLGISGGYLYSTHTNWFNRTGFLPFITLSGVLFVTYFFLQRPDVLDRMAGYLLAYGSSFYSLLFLLLILSLAYSKSIITKAMSMPFLILLGESSYSLYILQKPIYYFYSNYIWKYISVHLTKSEDVKFYIFIFLLIFISIISFYFIEKPGKRWILAIYAYRQKKGW